jgi:hypothetical protein
MEGLAPLASTVGCAARARIAEEKSRCSIARAIVVAGAVVRTAGSELRAAVRRRSRRSGSGKLRDVPSDRTFLRARLSSPTYARTARLPVVPMRVLRPWARVMFRVWRLLALVALPLRFNGQRVCLGRAIDRTHGSPMDE